MRQDLQIFLKEFGGALDKYGGAAGLPGVVPDLAGGLPSTPPQVNQALLGTQPGDLAGFVSNLDVVARELNANSADLQGLISNLNTVSGAFAANQASLREAIIELPQTLAVGRPALFKLNRDFPPLRAFAREALPGVKAANKALDFANPWIGQLRQLVSKPELRGLVKDLRPDDPGSRRAQQRHRCPSSSRPGRCPPASTTSSSPGATPPIPQQRQRPAGGQGLPGDRLRLQRRRGREPLRRRQRPGVPRARRRRHEHDRAVHHARPAGPR